MAPTEGFWGKQTSTMDWCEENYVVSYYIAEFWNTLSNVLIFLPPAIMLVLGYKQGHETRFLLSFFAITVVGIGSWLFHMTLQYSMQLMDEVPMLWGSTCFIYVASMRKSKYNEDNLLLQLGLFIMCTTVTLTYIWIVVPEFLQISYGVLNVAVVILEIRMAIEMECERKLFILGLASYALGALFWSVDNIFCQDLRTIRRHRIGQSSGMLFECHAWWHVFSGTGAYLGLIFALHTRYLYLQRRPRIKFFLGFWPFISIPPADEKWRH